MLFRSGSEEASHGQRLAHRPGRSARTIGDVERFAIALSTGSLPEALAARARLDHAALLVGVPAVPALAPVSTNDVPVTVQ